MRLRFSVRVRIRVRVRVMVEGATKPRAPGTLALEKACQGEHSTAPTILTPHFSHLGDTQRQRTQPQPKVIIIERGRVNFYNATKPTAPGTVGLERACLREHGTAPTLLPPNLAHLGNRWW